MILLPDEYGIEILRTEVGSTLHGTGLGVALEDHDEMAIYVEWPESTIGLHQRDHYVTRTAPEGERSQPGDTDLVCYSARKWARLALDGNPSVLLPLFAPEPAIMNISVDGWSLRESVQWFASRRAGRAFLGYMEKQRQRLTGERGRAGRIRTRGECEICGGLGVVPVEMETSGYVSCEVCGGSGQLPDWKYAMHMLRLGHQGVEYLMTGSLSLPIPDPLGEHLRKVRRGEFAIGVVLDEAVAIEEHLKDLIEFSSPLPPEPDSKAVEEWLIDTHLSVWRSCGVGVCG